MNVETLGLIAGTLTTASFFPQVWKIWKSRSAADISWAMAIVICIGTSLWTVYGVIVGSWPIIVSNAIIAILALAICAMKWHFETSSARN